MNIEEIRPLIEQIPNELAEALGQLTPGTHEVQAAQLMELLWAKGIIVTRAAFIEKLQSQTKEALKNGRELEDANERIIALQKQEIELLKQKLGEEPESPLKVV